MPSGLGLRVHQLRRVSLLRAGGAPLKALQLDNVAPSSKTRRRTGPLDPAAARGGSRMLRERAQVSCQSNDTLSVLGDIVKPLARMYEPL